MSRFSLTAFAGAALLLAGAAAPVGAQLPVQDWTDRPDARAPSGIRGDALLAPRTFDVRYQLRTVSFETILHGTDEIPPIWVFQDWEMAALSMSSQRHELEVEYGILDWLGASLRVPYIYHSTEFAYAVDAGSDHYRFGSTTSGGIGDIELHLLYGLHDAWPYRAHLTAGVSLPSGSVARGGETPDRPGQTQVLPYGMQPGDGTWGLLPGAVFVAENEFGTVGIQAEARIRVGENNRDWSRANEFQANVWMGYRFTDWVSGSFRVNYQTAGEISGFDPEMNPSRSPMHLPWTYGGTRVMIPVGMNIAFPEGPLRGNRASVEFLIPGHQDLNGPQLKMKYGATLTWAVSF